MTELSGYELLICLLPIILVGVALALLVYMKRKESSQKSPWIAALLNLWPFLPGGLGYAYLGRLGWFVFAFLVNLLAGLAVALRLLGKYAGCFPIVVSLILAIDAYRKAKSQNRQIAVEFEEGETIEGG